jgi:outer membrane biosynthesis protein TonB
MQITVTFESLEEFQKYVQTAQAPAGQPEAPKPVEKPKKAEKPAEKPQEPAEKPQEPAEKPQDEEPATAPAPEVPFEEDKPKMDMVTARKILADLNKAAGTNVARATLKKLGYASLKAVPEDKLQEVVDAARKEASNA